jgi:hypothetical protein
LYFQGKYGKFVVLNHHLWFYKITLCYITSFFLKEVADVKSNQTPNSPSAGTLSQRASESFVSTGVVARKARKFYGVKSQPVVLQNYLVLYDKFPSEGRCW